MVGVYVMYLCFSALESEPKEYECNGLGQQITAASGSTLAVGMLVTLLSVVYAAFRAGSNTHLFTLEGSDDGGDAAPERAALLAEEGTSAGLDGVPEEQLASREARSGAAAGGTALDDFRPVTYNYSFFHLIFALASMYIAMLMTGWGAQVCGGEGCRYIVIPLTGWSAQSGDLARKCLHRQHVHAVSLVGAALLESCGHAPALPHANHTSRLPLPSRCTGAGQREDRCWLGVGVGQDCCTVGHWPAVPLDARGACHVPRPRVCIGGRAGAS